MEGGGREAWEREKRDEGGLDRLSTFYASPPSSSLPPLPPPPLFFQANVRRIGFVLKYKPKKTSLFCTNSHFFVLVILSGFVNFDDFVSIYKGVVSALIFAPPFDE